MAGRPFSIYRIVCTITDRALVSNSDWPNLEKPYERTWEPGSQRFWYYRGSWGKTGSFWRTKATVKRHLWQLCHDWRSRHEWRYNWRHEKYLNSWHERITDEPDWSRLDHLIVEETVVQAHTVSEINANDFMGRASVKSAEETI